ncbi:unnamed protein product [Bursaphelenchus okinawaensis]|uniref:Uncharacterized protein n=1 Tax=Bursaphelenchus okinawaensis TaxID=465554 RepID=A0A811KK86_9BILA|nr:unnamed protein product [Bursaphelenchus okinawaensis]CAG9104613.1 unnamed protein product [Bursaphelenchus okinawaensis]
MNLSWAEKLAKNALLTAQKRIDSVLDIKPEEEQESSEQTVEVKEEKEEEEKEQSSIFEDVVEGDISDEGNDQEPQTEYLDVEEAPEHECNAEIHDKHDDGWGKTFSPLSVDKEDVVEAEPNPIRDGHGESGTSLLHYSPASNSPDEEESHPSDSHEHHEHDNRIDLSLIKDIDTASLIKEDHREDVATVASSDIVVIRNVDDWSVASGSHRRAPSDQVCIIGNGLSGKYDSYNNEALNERMSALEAQLKHRDQRITELSHQNEKLKIQNTNLLQKNKSMNTKLGTESKLQKKLQEKENELAELMAEGNNLSLLNGKQAKELKRLKDVEKDFETQRTLLQDAMDNNHELTDDKERLEKENQLLKAKILEQEKEFQEVKSNLNSKTEAHEDLKLAEKRCASQKLQITQLEQRVDELMTAQREAAEQIALSTGPLHTRIEELESEVKEANSAKYVIQKKLRFAEENLENTRTKANEEAALYKQQLNSLRLQNKEHLDKIRELEKQNNELLTEISNQKTLSNVMESDLLSEINQFKELVHKKEQEVSELKSELVLAHQKKMEKPAVVQFENDQDLNQTIVELEREANYLRTKFKELEEAHDTLLLIHGESAVRLEELEQENQEIKKLCKDQTLLLSSLHN